MRDAAFQKQMSPEEQDVQNETVPSPATSDEDVDWLKWQASMFMAGDDKFANRLLAIAERLSTPSETRELHSATNMGTDPHVAPLCAPSAIARSDLYPAMAKPIVHGQREQEDYRRALEAIIADPEADAVAIAHAAITPYTPWVAVDE